MKQILFTVILITLAISLSAQTGLFGISFGQNRHDVQEMLTKAGFKLDESKEDKLKFTNSKIKGLTELSVEFGSEGGVTSWEIKYNTKDNPELVDEITNQLTDLHEISPWWDDYWEEWVWELENYMAVYMYSSGEYLRVDYDEWDDSYDYWW